MKEIHRKLFSGFQDDSLRLSGGDDRDRTDDLRLAKAALSQLSYIPNGFKRPGLPADGARTTIPGSTARKNVPGKNGGRSWNRTSDLILIRDAL